MLISERKKKYLSSKKVISVHCHGIRFVYASLLASKKEKLSGFDLKCRLFSTLGDWDLF